MGYVYVAAGGALGSVARFWLAEAMGRLTGPVFPWGTVLINVAGSFAIGVLAVVLATPDRLGWRAFAMVGVCGGFTTFSAFSLQTLVLLRAGRPDLAAWNVALSLVLCLAAVAAGFAVAARG